MSVRAKVRTLEEVVEQGVHEYFETDDLLIHEIAEELVWSLDNGELYSCAARGLANMIQDKVRKQERRAEKEYAKSSQGQAERARVEEDVARMRAERAQEETKLKMGLVKDIFQITGEFWQKMYQASDGEKKTLLDFTKNDHDYRAGYCDSQSQSWSRMSEFHRLASKRIEEHGAVTARELPEGEAHEIVLEGVFGDSLTSGREDS